MAAPDLAARYRLLLAQATLKARHSLLPFIQVTKPDYEARWFHIEICRVLDAFERGEVKKLMIFVPPQHGKSQISSRHFPAYALGRNPDRKIALCSYGGDHAQAFNRDVQRIIDDEAYHRIFPHTTLNQSNVATTAQEGYKRTANIFEVVGHRGFMKTVGIGGPLTGTTVDIGIIDDPFKDRREAESEVTRNHVWNWYTDVFEMRLHNDSQQLMLFTRWHEDDLAGRALARDGITEEGGEWAVIKFPAIREPGQHVSQYVNDPRQPGEALWEEKHTAEKYHKMRQEKPRTYYSLAQQEPTPVEGNVIKRSWFEYRNEKLVPENLTWDLWIDGAYTGNTANDPTGLMAAAFDKMSNTLYIRHAHSAYMEMPRLLSFVPEYASMHGLGRRSRAYIEPKASGKSLQQMLRALPGLVISPVEIKNHLVQEGKESRANEASPRIEAGKVVLIEGSWNDAFVTEVSGFPNAPHDEFIDLLGYACFEYFPKEERRGIRRRN